MSEAFAPDEANVVRHTITASSAQQTLSAGLGKPGAWLPVRICNLATAACYIRTGSNPTATTSSLTIPGNGFTEVLRFEVPKDGPLKVAIIGTASSGVVEFTTGVSGI